jgi:multidrug resistance efflux pump
MFVQNDYQEAITNDKIKQAVAAKDDEIAQLKLQCDLKDAQIAQAMDRNKTFLSEITKLQHQLTQATTLLHNIVKEQSVDDFERHVQEARASLKTEGVENE